MVTAAECPERGAGPCNAASHGVNPAKGVTAPSGEAQAAADAVATVVRTEGATVPVAWLYRAAGLASTPSATTASSADRAALAADQAATAAVSTLVGRLYHCCEAGRYTHASVRGAGASSARDPPKRMRAPPPPKGAASPPPLHSSGRGTRPAPARSGSAPPAPPFLPPRAFPSLAFLRLEELRPEGGGASTHGCRAVSVAPWRAAGHTGGGGVSGSAWPRGLLRDPLGDARPLLALALPAALLWLIAVAGRGASGCVCTSVFSERVPELEGTAFTTHSACVGRRYGPSRRSPPKTYVVLPMLA